MKIDRIEAIPYAIPYARPLKFASGEVTSAEHVLVRIYTDTGICGIADTPPRPYTYGETQDSIVSVVTKVFAPQLIGLDPLDRSKVQQLLRRTVNNPTAKGALDIALWDVIGISLGTPVHKLLGGFTDSMRVSHMLGFKPAAELLEEALRFREKYGINTFKLKTGRRPLSLDVEACHVLREGLGEDAEIYLDANRGWTANEAMEVLRRTEGLGLSMLEEPCDAGEAMGRRRLVQSSSIPIVGDERSPPWAMSPANCFPAAAPRSALRLRAAVSPKPSRSSASAWASAWTSRWATRSTPRSAASPRSPLVRRSRPAPGGPGSSPTTWT